MKVLSFLFIFSSIFLISSCSGEDGGGSIQVTYFLTAFPCGNDPNGVRLNGLNYVFLDADGEQSGDTRDANDGKGQCTAEIRTSLEDGSQAFIAASTLQPGSESKVSVIVHFNGKQVGSVEATGVAEEREDLEDGGSRVVTEAQPASVSFQKVVEVSLSDEEATQ